MTLRQTERRERATYIYEPIDTYSSSSEGWELVGESRLDEPLVDRHTEELASVARSTRRRIIGPSFFTLSGGILRRDPRTSNRIDSMLTNMLDDSPGKVYSPHVDKNLDYLHTSLQLDMISMVALESKQDETHADSSDQTILE
jgi:hypothetical protein